jgi:hypothetical protein
MQMPNGLSPIGIAFPKYNIESCNLGNMLRLFAKNRETLECFNTKKWLHCLSD